MLEHHGNSALAPGITVVVTCYGKTPELKILVHSLLFQENYINHRPVSKNNTDLEIIISSDGPYEGPSEILSIPNIKLIENNRANIHGHNTRGPGIYSATKEWVVLTNDDNYYTAGWLDKVSAQIRPNIGVIFWSHINSLHGYKFVDTNPKLGEIDLGCLAVRTHISREIGFPFRKHEGDYEYAHACIKRSLEYRLRVVKLPEVLFVHN